MDVGNAFVNKVIFEPEYHIITELAPKYLYGDTKSGLFTNSTNSTIDDCSPFCDEADFCERQSNNVFFALRIEPTAPLLFSAITYKAENDGDLKKDNTLFYVEEGKRKKMSDFKCMPMVLVRDVWEEHPELIGFEIKKWIDILAKQDLYPYPCHGYGNEKDHDIWFAEDYER